MINLTRASAISLRYFYLVRDNWTRIFQIFVWAVLDVVLWGFITKYLDQVGSATTSFVPSLLGAVLLWDFVSRAQQGVSSPFLEDIWSKNLLNLFASPLTIGEYVAGLVTSAIATSAVGIIAMYLLALAVFGFSLFVFGAALAAFVGILFIFGITIGILAIAIILRLGPSAEWFVWPIPAVLAPFVGVFYPVSILPDWMQMISRLLPPSYVFDGVRAVASGASFAADDLVIGFALAIAYLIAACIVFAYTYKRAVESGAIARYSAESGA